MPCQHRAPHRGADPTAGCSRSQVSPAAESGPRPRWAEERCAIILTLHQGGKSPAGTDPTLPVSVLLGLRVAQLILAARNCSGVPPDGTRHVCSLGSLGQGRGAPSPLCLFHQTDLRRPISEGGWSYRTCSSGPTVLRRACPMLSPPKAGITHSSCVPGVQPKGSTLTRRKRGRKTT